MNQNNSTSWFIWLIEVTGNSMSAIVLWFGFLICLALVIHRIIIVLLRHVIDNNGIGQSILKRTNIPIGFAFILLAITFGLQSVDMNSKAIVFLHQVTKIGLIGLIGWTAILTINSIAETIQYRRRIDVEDNLDARRIHTQIQILRRALLITIFLLTSGAILMTFPEVQTFGVSLFASAGIAGLIMGFAARPILSNLIAGVQIALTQPIRIDDVVIVEGEWGWIEEITSTYVVIRIWDLRRLIIPLSHFIEKPFQNWTRESASIIGTVTWHLDYTAPIDRMRVKLKELLRDHSLWDKEVANIQVIGAEQSTIIVRALVSAKNSSQAWDLRCDIREQMLTWLQEEHPMALPRLRTNIENESINVTNASELVE